MYHDGRAERSGKAAKAGKVVKGPLFGLPAGVVPLSNNSRQTDITAMMPDFNADDLDPLWDEPEAEEVQAFFDNLSENYVRDEPLLIRDTTKEELDYIAARAAEAALAREAGSAGHVEDEADAAAEEKELAGWAESAGEASSTGIGAPLIEDVVKESTKEEAEALGRTIREKYPVERMEINYVGPVIGNHSGPGTLALFFQGKHK